MKMNSQSTKMDFQVHLRFKIPSKKHHVVTQNPCNVLTARSALRGMPADSSFTISSVEELTGADTVQNAQQMVQNPLQQQICQAWMRIAESALTQQLGAELFTGGSVWHNNEVTPPAVEERPARARTAQEQGGLMKCSSCSTRKPPAAFAPGESTRARV